MVAARPATIPGVYGVNFKLALHGTIRMETPMLYFYSPRDVAVSARVAFAKGLITEWYPRVDRVEPGGVVPNTSLSQLSADGSITGKTGSSSEQPRQSLI